eukprot:TRINITY_DN1130_c0_g1_i1.p1 TRINITY_DN1130_c0_g1~~TRINITY_DN1130_c0_g1_i1.p1  ORF type:complete len:300 (+),score=26.88 TRINITY_DN1130_c0_g1_i1:190-1089(+)
MLPTYYHALLYVPVSLSIFGSSFILLSYFLFKRGKDSLHTLIAFIALSDLLAALMWLSAYIIGPYTSECIFQALGLEFFVVSSWFWPLIFSFRLFFIYVLDKEVNNVILFNVISWGIPFIFCIVCYEKKILGVSGIWCWITDSKFQLIFGEGLLVLMFLMELFMFLLISIRLNAFKTQFVSLETRKRSAVTRFSLFLLVPVICWSFGTIDRVIEAINGKSYLWLQIAHGITSGGQGFINAIVYGFDPSLLYFWDQLIFKRKRVFENSVFSSERLALNSALDEDHTPVNFSAKFYDEFER